MHSERKRTRCPTLRGSQLILSGHVTLRWFILFKWQPADDSLVMYSTLYSNYLTLWSRDNQQMTLWSCSHLALFSHVSQLILLTWQSPEFLLKWQLWSWFFGSVMQLVHFDHETVRKLFSQQSAEPLVTWSELDNINIKQFHEIGIESVLQNWHTKKIDRLLTLHHPGLGIRSF